MFEGNAQVLDHVLVNAAMLASLNRFTYARNNTDFPESFETDFSVTTRLSDHDAAVAYFGAIADLGVALTTTSPVSTGGVWAAQMSVSNGLETATDITLSVLLPAGVAWQSTTAPAGWTCTTSSGIVSCNRNTFEGGASAAFEIAGSVACTAAAGSALGVSAVIGSATREFEAGNNTASASAAVSNPAPMITDVAPSRTQLLLPLHQFVRVNVRYNAADACGPVSVALTVTSDEPVTGSGQGLAGLTSLDWIVVDEHLVLLRAERSPRGDGRTYTITITAIDTAGDVSTQDVTVTVPR